MSCKAGSGRIEFTAAESARVEQLLKTRCEIDSHGCWNWLGGRKSSDELYGAIAFRGRSWRAHRLAFAWGHGGRLPVGICRHLCGNSQCVNPKHLSGGSHSENLRDAYEQGSRERLPVGALSGEDIMLIDRCRRRGLNSREIADELFMPQSTVHDHLAAPPHSE